METGRSSRSVFDRPLRRDPILVVWALLNAVVAAASLNSHTTWSGSVESARVMSFVKDVTTAAMLSYLLLALLPALLRRWLRGPLSQPTAGIRSAWAPDVHAGLEPSAETWPAPHPHPCAAAPPMFDRPLRRDPIVVFWLLFAGLMALLALNANTTWSGSLEAARVSSFLSDVTVISLVSFLLLCLFPAYVRWCWRGGPLWRWYDGRRVWWWQAMGDRGVWGRPPWSGMNGPWGPAPAGLWTPQPSLAKGAQGFGPDLAEGAVSDFGFFGQREDAEAAAPGASVSSGVVWRRDSAPWRQSQIPYAGKRGLLPARAQAMPSFTRIDLPAGPLPRGVPVPVSWDTDGAHSVTINGKPGYPPRGFAEVTLEDSGPCSFTAEGSQGASRHAWTAPVPLIDLPMPHIELPTAHIELPAGPAVKIHAAVDLSDGRKPLADTLRSITERRLAFRPTAEPTPNTTTPSAPRFLGLDLKALFPTNRPTSFTASRSREAPTSPGEP